MAGESCIFERWNREASTAVAPTLPVPLVTKMLTGEEEHARELERQRDEARTERDRWIRLFNRLEASVTHHRAAKLRGVDTSDEVDGALWAARDKVLKAAATETPTRTTEGPRGRVARVVRRVS